MPLLTYPGVYREEIQTQTQVVQDVSTANLGLTGFFKKGPVEEPVLVTDLNEAFRIFGDFTAKSIAATTLAAYFDNGGVNAFINRVIGAGSAQALASFEKVVVDEDTTKISTGGGGVDVLAIQLGEEDIEPGSLRLFFNETADVTGEVVGTGDTILVTFPLAIANVPIEPTTLVITDGSETFTETGTGVLTGDAGGSGTIDYVTGVGSVTFFAAPAAVSITAAYSHAVAGTLQTEGAGSQRIDQRVYHGQLDNRWPVWYSITFSWTDQGSTGRTAVSDSLGVISGEGTGSVDLMTGVFTLDVGAFEVAVGGSITATYYAFASLTAGDDGAGALTTTGGLVSVGTIDYATGAVTATTVALDDVGEKFWVDYDAEIHHSQAKNPGLSGNNLSMEIAADLNFLDPATGLYSKYSVTVFEVDAEGNKSTRDPFSLMVLDDLTDAKHVSQIVNDPFLGSSLVEMVTPFSEEIPTVLKGGTVTGELLDSGTGVKRAIATTLQLFGGTALAPNTLNITYTSGTATMAITDDGQGGLTGDVDTSVTSSIDYETGLLLFTPSVAPDNATPVEAAYTHQSPSVLVEEQYVGGLDGAAITRSEVTDIALQASKGGLYALELVDEILIISTPDFAGDWVAEAAQLSYAGVREDSMVLLAPPEGSTVAQAINYKRNVLASVSNRGAMYHPWINIEDPITGNTLAVPPHGHVAGIWGRTDSNRNIGKSPAGTRDGALSFLLGFKDDLDKDDVGLLTDAHVNALWQPQRQPRSVWGVRTLEVDGEFRFINKRRTIDFTSVSVARSMWWAVFENVGPSLFVPVRRQIESFLRRNWLLGIYKGETEVEAFFVKVDRGNNPTETQNAGQLIVDYGVSTQTPGEFIRLRHRQLAA